MKAVKSGSSSIIAMRTLRWLIAVALCVPAIASAALTASLDRYAISMGETVRLTISSDNASDPSDIDFSALQQHFDILQRSSSVSTQITNGQRQQRRELVLEITPRREGSVTIPGFRAGADVSEPLRVQISPEPQLAAGDEVVFFEAEVDRESVYVQGQLLLTLRIQQSVTLDSRSVTELEIDNAVVKTLGQNSFQRTIDGRPWLVHEIRVAIFPQSSGTLTIPQQTFSGRLSSGRRSLFDTRPAGRLLQRRTEEITIDVKPRPASFSDPVWLPAAEVTIEEQWSAADGEIRVGDSLTRSITLTAKGLQGTQLPPLSMAAPDGLRIYPDQPGINELDGESGVTGIRTDSLAIVAVRAGTYELEPVTVRWWDTTTDQLREVSLPGKTLRVVSPPLPDAATAAPPSQAPVSSDNAGAVAVASAGIWPWLSAFLACGWLATALLVWRRRQRPVAHAASQTDTPATRKALLAACREGNAALARERMRQWLLSEDYHGTLEQWAMLSGSDALCAAVQELEAHLFSGEASTGGWDGAALAAALKSLPARRDPAHATRDPLPPLYPASS